MVGIVIVSHSHRIAEGVAELAREMGGPDVRLETAGGLAMPDHPIGTDAVLVMEAIERAWSDDGVVVLMDLGSAVLSAEMALDLLPEDRRENVLLCEAPIVEGAVAAAVTAKLGATLERVAAEARGGLAGKIAHLGTGSDVHADAPSIAIGGRSIRFRIELPHGLHARPAARFVQTATSFEASVHVRDLTNARGPADAASLNAVAMLAATRGHELEVTASGPQADAALAAIDALARRGFDEGPDSAGGTPEIPEDRGPVADGSLRGHPASPGIAMGPLVRFHETALHVPDAVTCDPSQEARALDAAVEDVAHGIALQRGAVAARAGEAEAQIFDAHLLFLRDPTLLGPAREAIADGASAARAWRDVVERTASGWDALEDAYLRARAADLRSVGDQVLARILNVPMPLPALSAPGILAATDLSPADTIALDPAVALGIATAAGGPTAHAAVLARSLGIPAVVGVGERLLDIPEGTSIAVDGGEGLVYISPPDDVVGRLTAARDARIAATLEARAGANAPARTIDGTVVEVAVNIGSPVEALAGVVAGADGVGLFRTEFLFLGRTSMPDEREQEAAYREAAVALGGRPMIVRTLDVGADKPLPFLAQPHEDNPFLGVRGIRLGFARPDLLRGQLRALCRVARDHPLRVMFPMVATAEELRAAKAVIDEVRDDATLEIGVMIEVPSAALIADRLAPDVDFFSIGTNDLTQYTLAADRGNARVASIADPLHPAVLALIATTVAAADAHGRWVGVCGELAGDPVATGILLGLGVRELSMSAPAIAFVKHAVRRTDLDRARALADEALTCATATEVRALIADGGPA